ncbi:hypothetical protein [Lentzea sp. NPDC060358]
MRVLGEAVGMLMGGRPSGRHVTWLEEGENVFGLDRKAAPPVIGQ